jgi:hypothetical protein
MVLPSNATNVAKEIYKLPEIRPVEQRRPDELRLEKNPANLEATLGYTRGHAPPTPCENCVKSRPRGPFSSCIVVDQRFDGACSNCRYNNNGIHCTLHRMNARPNDPADPRSPSAKPQPPKPRSPTKARTKAAKLIKSANTRDKGKGKQRAVSEDEEHGEGEGDGGEEEEEPSMVDPMRQPLVPGGTITPADFPQNAEDLRRQEEQATHPRTVAKDRMGKYFPKGG